MLDLYKNIKKLRMELGLSQDALAKMTGYTDRSSIAKIEKGEVDLQQSKIVLFAKALNTTPKKLMGWSEMDSPDIEVERDGTKFTIESDKNTDRSDYKRFITVAAHLRGAEDLTQEELDDVNSYIEFIKNKRK